MPKQARLRGIKSFRCYTIAEAAEVTGVSTRTIRNWSKDGLRLMDSDGPALIRGDDLRGYIKAQRESRKVATAIDEFLCFRCRAARKPAAGYAECAINGNRAKLSAFCERCDTIMHKPFPKARIAELSQHLDLTITRLGETL